MIKVSISVHRIYELLPFVREVPPSAKKVQGAMFIPR